MMLSKYDCVRDAGVGGSNPLTPTIKSITYQLPGNTGKFIWRTYGALIGERSLQMLNVLIDMAIDLRQHGAVSMAHDCGDSQMIVPLDEFTGSEPMPSVIASHALACGFGKTIHAIADCIFSPSAAPIISENFALCIFAHQARDDGKGVAMQIDGARIPLALGFERGEGNGFLFKIHMPGLNMANLLRSASGIPDKQKQVAEWIVFTQESEDILVIFRLHMIVAPIRRGLFDLLKRAGRNMAHFFCPIEGALHSDDASALVGVSPLLVRINPFNNVKWLEAYSLGVRIFCKMLKKALDMPLIPFQTSGRSMLAAPGQIFVEESVNRYVIFHAIEYSKTHRKRQELAIDI